MTSSAIEIHDLVFSYGGARVLEDINLGIDAGEFFGLIGPNAAGKSTLLKLILGLLEPDRGSIRVLGDRPAASRGQLGYVPQFPTFQRDFPITVSEVVISGRINLTATFGGYSSADRGKAAEVMAALEIEDIAEQQVAALSGGQTQRMLIARALVCDPAILIMDEPTSNIDIRAEQDIFSLLRVYNSRMTIIVVSHDIGFISSYVGRVGCLNRTLVCHNTAELSGRDISELYGMGVRMIDHSHSGHN
jgi:zinc transport system ATP-binding protein